MGKISSQVTDISSAKTQISVTGIGRLFVHNTSKRSTNQPSRRFCAFFFFYAQNPKEMLTYEEALRLNIELHASDCNSRNQFLF